MEGFGKRALWMGGLVLLLLPLWTWIGEQMIAWRAANVPSIMLAFGILFLVAVHAWIGSKIPFYKISSGGREVETPVDPILFLAVLASIVVYASRMTAIRYSANLPAVLVFALASTCLAWILRTSAHFRRIYWIAAVTYLITAIMCFVAFYWLVLRVNDWRQDHPGVFDPRFELIYSAIWVSWCTSMGVWAATVAALRMMAGKRSWIALSIFGMAALSLALAYYSPIGGSWVLAGVPLAGAYLLQLGYAVSISPDLSEANEVASTSHG